MTDNEIIKALECCSKEDCGNCPVSKFGSCIDNTMEEALALINRQKGEIERLRENQDTLTTVLARSFAVKLCGGNPVAEIKSEALKKFAERLKEYKCSYETFNYPSFYAVEIEDIDNLVKKMVGADK